MCVNIVINKLERIIVPEAENALRFLEEKPSPFPQCFLQLVA
jgi:hypothetical protein